MNPKKTRVRLDKVHIDPMGMQISSLGSTILAPQNTER